MLNKQDENFFNKQLFYFILAVGLSALVIFIDLPQSILNSGDPPLTPSGQTSLGILVFALVLWISEAIPFHITGLLAMVLLAVFNVDTFKTIVMEGFGNDAIVFFIGVLILSSFISKSGMGKRISMFILSLTGNSTSKIIFGFIIVGAVLSMWITNMAVAAMLMPLAKAILEEEKLKPLESNFGKALLIACAWGPTIGGIATPSGCAPNPISISLLKEIAGIDISFGQWMLYGLPAGLVLIIPSWLILVKGFKPEISHLSRSKEDLKSDYQNLPPIDREEKLTMIIFSVTVILWLSSTWLGNLLGISIPISLPPIFASCLFFLPNATRIKWREIESEIAWDSIILVVSGISLGMMLYESGAAGWLSASLLGGLVHLHPLLLIFVIVLITAFLKVAFSSNAVTATVLIPIVITLALNSNINPMLIAFPAAITSSLCYLLVTSSPTNVIPYAAGYFTIKDFAKVGVIMTIVSTILIALVIYGIGLMTNLF